MDVLTDVIRALQFESALVFRTELSAPWGVRLSGRHAAAFHFLLRGGGQIEVDGSKRPIDASAGDLVVLPRDRPHVVRDARKSRVVPFESLVPQDQSQSLGVLRLGGGGAVTSALSACFHLSASHLDGFLQALPPVIVLRGEELRALPWLDPLLQSLAAEAASERPGALAIVTRLSEVVFIHAVRFWLESSRKSSGWAAALRDPQIARALSGLHARPGGEWSVERLAKEAGMSRSAFAQRFAETVGEPPMSYVTRWRVHRASELLREPGSALADVAERVGYASEAAFSRVFKRITGQSPAAWRRTARAS